jgi:iron complex outermembrane receptor protein
LLTNPLHNNLQQCLKGEAMMECRQANVGALRMNLRVSRELYLNAACKVGSSMTLLSFLLLPVAAVADEDDVSSLQEIVVTATKRPTKLFDTPISMTVLTDTALESINAESFGDVTRLIPGLTAIDSGPGQKRYALRGLQSPGEPEVALYYDEIPIRGLPGNSLDSGDDQPDFKLWDVDRIEVLRGPQGTLYGNGSMGGAVRIISKRPDLDHFEAASGAVAGTTDGGGPSWRVNEMVNVPLLEDRLAIRLTGYFDRDGGFINEPAISDTNVAQFTGSGLNWAHTWGGRATVALRATDSWTVTAIAYYQNLNTGNSNETYPAYATSRDPYVSKAFSRTPWDDESRMFNLISTYELGWADFVVTGSYQKRIADLNIGTTRANLSLFGCTLATWKNTCFGPPIVPADSLGHESVSATSGEARLVSKDTDALAWTLGSFVQNATTRREGLVATTDGQGYIAYNPTTNDPNDEIFARNNEDAFDQHAVYGEATYEILRRFKVTVGLRWFDSYRSDQQSIVHQFSPTQPLGAEPFQEFRENALYKKFELSYALNPDALFYANASQGFRAGGPNYPGGFTTTAPPYGPDSIWDYELGWKLALADRRVAWTGAVFRINWSDIQQLVPQTLFSYIINAGSARSDGFETEIEATLVRGLSLGIGATFNNAHLVGPQPLSTSPSAQLESGDRLGGVPEWTTSATLNYVHALDSTRTIDARADYTYQSSRPSVVATASPAYFIIPGGGLTGLHVSVDDDRSWNVGLHVENLFNRYVALSGKSLDGNLVESITPARPRTFSISALKRFQ